MATAPAGLERQSGPSKADLEQELINVRAEQEAPLMRARARFAERVFEDIDWWYNEAKKLALHGDSHRDQVKQQMIKVVLDKVCPDRKEISRGAANIAGVSVTIGDIPGRGDQAPPITVDGEHVQDAAPGD